MKKSKQGFTLIELMIVMVLMGVLAMIGVSAFFASQMKGRDATRKAHLRSIASALELYYNDKNQYPVGVTGSIKGCETYSGELCTEGNQFIDANGTVYMARLPSDPNPNQQYYYVSSNGKQFQIYAHLENTQDMQIIVPQAANTDCGSECNFGISSANTTP